MRSLQGLRRSLTTDPDGRRKLDLSNRNLDQVPKAVSSIEELEVLDLSGNPISTIPSSLTKLNNLRVLILNDCALKDVTVLPRLSTLHALELAGNTDMENFDAHLSRMKNLRRLNLSRCGLNGIEVGDLKELEELDLTGNPIKKCPEGLEKLQTLNLSKCGWTEIGDEVTKLTSLKTLNLSENPIKCLPKSLANLKELQELNLWNCNLSCISVITQLSNLKSLFLANNKQIKRLPKGLSSLKALRELNLGNCGLTQIPTDICQLTSLEELFIPNNEIKILPEGLSNLTQLKKLGLWDCSLTQPEIMGLTSLEELFLGGNNIGDTSGLKDLKNVQRVDLRNCGLENVGSTILDWTSLTFLNLSENLIGCLPQELSSFRQIRKLYLNRCAMKEFPVVLTQLSSLEVLYLAENPLENLPEQFSNFTKLKELGLWNCRLTEIGVITSHLTALEELFLTGNNLAGDPINFSNLKKLRRLHLKDCGLSGMPATITELSLIEDLNLSGNHLGCLPKSISYLKELKKLSVWNCELFEICEEICDIPTLQNLNLGKNRFRSIPLNLTKLKHLEDLNLSKNPRLQRPPKEVSELGITEIFSYLSEIRHRESLQQKVILLGSSRAGKTSLVKTILNGTPSCVDADDRTILLDKFIWEPKRDGKHLSVTFIDFGGNKWYNIVHHLFIDESSIFLLLVDLAEYTSNAKFHEHVGSWIDTLLTRVPGAACVILGTHTDMLTPMEISSRLGMIESEVKCKFAKEGVKISVPPIMVISSETMEGIPDMQDKLLCLVCERGKAIPSNWLHLYQRLIHKKEKPFLLFEEVRSIARTSRKRRRDTISSEGSGNNADAELQTILRFFHAIGSILWYQHPPSLAGFIFHNPEYLTKLLKSVFSERLETQSLCYDEELTFRKEFSKSKFEQVKTRLLDQGIMPRELLQCLWEYRDIDGRVFEAMIQLFLNLDLCYPLNGTESRVESLRFPWFLKESVPENTDVQQILFGPPAEDCFRLTIEYVFCSVCPPPLYEKFAVRVHRHVRDTNSRIDWKDGVYTNIHQSRLAVHRINDCNEALVSLTVEGEDIVELWEILTSLDKEMNSVVDEWRGVKWETWLLCPHCLQDGINKPGRFNGEHLSSPYPVKCPTMTCPRDAKVKVPSCLLYPVEEFSQIPRKHRENLEQFKRQSLAESKRGDTRFVGLGRLNTGGITIEFSDLLNELSNSVGIIRAQTPFRCYTGTVFRVGQRHVMTCYHVAEGIYGVLDENWMAAEVCFNYHKSTQGQQVIERLEGGIQWCSRDLDVAVLKLRIPFYHYLPPALGNLGDVNQSGTFHLIGHCNGWFKTVNLCCEKRLPEHQDVQAVLGNPELATLLHPCKTLMEPSMTFGASGCPCFNDHGELVLMETNGVFVREKHVMDQCVNLSDVYRLLSREDPVLARELFELQPQFEQGMGAFMEIA